MMPGLFGRRPKPSNQPPPTVPTQRSSDPFPTANSIEDKIRWIFATHRREAYQEDVRRARIYYRCELYYRGYQSLGPFDEDTMTYPVYDDEGQDFGENRFRRNALILAGLLVRMEPTAVIRPGSESPLDLESAIANEQALEIIHEEIGIDRIKSEKSLMKVLFGNCFVYSDYQVDRRFGTILVPKYKYDTTTLPGAAVCPGGDCGSIQPEGTEICPECAMPMTQVPSMPVDTQTPNGFESRDKGQIFSAVCSPLEVKIRAKTKGGLENAPYLLWITKEDIDAVKYVYPSLDVQPQGHSGQYGVSGTAEYENALRYQDILAALPGNIWGSVRPYWATTNYFDQVDVIRGWIHPMLYKNDKELLKEAPDGLMGVQVEGELAEWRPERLTDHWTHEKYIVNPHSAYGDGIFDDVPMQRALNVINQLIIRHLEYDTVPLRLFDADLVIETDISNDPAKKWIACNVSPEKGLDKAVRDLPAQTLSMDVMAFKAQVYNASNDITGATDPIAGKTGNASTPYSSQVLANEQGQVRHLPMLYYNTMAVQAHTRQVLKIAEENWIDPRKRTNIDPTTGRPQSVSIVGADLSRGEISIKVLTNDFKPKLRSEMMQAMEYMKEFGIDPTATPRMRLEFFEKIGFTPEGDMLNTQTRRTYRHIERMKNGQVVTPDPLIDDGSVQAPTIWEYLASKEGEDLLESNPTAFQAIRSYGVTMMQMQAMKVEAMMNMGLPSAPGAPPALGGGGGQGGPQGPQQGKPPGQPGGQPNGPGGQNGPPKPEMAQAPSPLKQAMPPLPAGARQT